MNVNRLRSVGDLRYDRSPLGLFGKVLCDEMVPLVRALTCKTGVDAGGADLLCHGDSIPAGGNASDMVTGTPTYHAMRALQAQFNPYGVAGGWGWIPTTKTSANNWNNPDLGVIAAYGAAPSTRWVLSNVATVPPGDYDPAPGRQMTRLGGGNSTATAVLTFSGHTSVGVTYTQSSSGGTSAWTLTEDGNSVASGDLNANGATVYGKQAILATGLDPALTYVLTLNAPVSGNMDLSGAMLFNGDERCGVRVAHMPNWGSRASGTDDLGLMKPTNSAAEVIALSANIDSFTGGALTSNAALGMTRAAAVITNWATNDETAAASSVTIFRAAVAEFNAYCLSKGLPVLWVIVPSQFGREANYGHFADAIVAEANATKGVLALSFWDALGRPAHGAASAGGYMYDRGWRADGTHYAGGFQAALGQYIASCIAWVVDQHQAAGTAW